MPKVSVIIPTHNRALLLKKAIQSVLDQSYADFEIMVYDDASTDDTRHVVAGFSDNRIRFTCYDTNRGVIKLRNEAITNSKGNYIAFLDDDDEWLPQKLVKQITILEGSPERLGAVYSGSYSTDLKLDRIIKTSIPTDRGNIMNNLLKNNFITTSSIIIKKRCFDKIGLFDPEYKSTSDFDMWIRIATEFDFDYIAEPLVVYRINQVSISTNYRAVISGLERLITKHHQLFSGDYKALGNHLFKLGIAYCYAGDTRQGRYLFFKAAKKDKFNIKIFYNTLLSVLGSKLFIKLKELKKTYTPMRLQN